MSSFYALAAGLTAFLPVLAAFGGGASSPDQDGPAPQCDSSLVQSSSGVQTANQSAPANSQVPSQLSGSNPLEAFYNSSKANQHRVQRRLTIRITPLRQSPRNNLFAQLPRRGAASDYVERKMSNCVPVSGIAGVQTGTGNRLILFLRDERIISLNLERGCEARDFYSGFYIERSDDGRLCVKRDLLQSRSGAKCEVERMRHLVKAEE